MQHRPIQNRSILKKIPALSALLANLGWRWVAVALIFVLGLVAFANGVGLTERPMSPSATLEQIYYILGLFVVGGLDLGMPVGGPMWANITLDSVLRRPL